MFASPNYKESSSNNDKEVKLLQKQVTGFQRSKTIVSYNTRHSISPNGKISNRAVFQNRENDEDELASLL